MYILVLAKFNLPKNFQCSVGGAVHTFVVLYLCLRMYTMNGIQSSAHLERLISETTKILKGCYSLLGVRSSRLSVHRMHAPP